MENEWGAFSLLNRFKTDMPKKIREPLRDLIEAGFREITGAGKWSHRKYVHPLYPGAVTLSGKLGDTSKPCQEKQVQKAIEEAKK